MNLSGSDRRNRLRSSTYKLREGVIPSRFSCSILCLLYPHLLSGINIFLLHKIRVQGHDRAEGDMIPPCDVIQAVARPHLVEYGSFQIRRRYRGHISLCVTHGHQLTGENKVRILYPRIRMPQKVPYACSSPPNTSCSAIFTASCAGEYPSYRLMPPSSLISVSSSFRAL